MFQVPQLKFCLLQYDSLIRSVGGRGERAGVAETDRVRFEHGVLVGLVIGVFAEVNVHIRVVFVRVDGAEAPDLRVVDGVLSHLEGSGAESKSEEFHFQ